MSVLPHFHPPAAVIRTVEKCPHAVRKVPGPKSQVRVKPKTLKLVVNNGFPSWRLKVSSTIDSSAPDKYDTLN